MRLPVTCRNPSGHASSRAAARLRRSAAQYPYGMAPMPRPGSRPPPRCGPMRTRPERRHHAEDSPELAGRDRGSGLGQPHLPARPGPPFRRRGKARADRPAGQRLTSSHTAQAGTRRPAGSQADLPLQHVGNGDVRGRPRPGRSAGPAPGSNWWSSTPVPRPGRSRKKIGVTATPRSRTGGDHGDLGHLAHGLTGHGGHAAEDHDLEGAGKLVPSTAGLRAGMASEAAVARASKASDTLSACTAARSPVPRLPAIHKSQASPPFTSPKTRSSGEPTRAERSRIQHVLHRGVAQYSPFSSGALSSRSPRKR